MYITLHAIDRRLTGVRDRQYGSIMNALPSSASSSAATLGCLAFLAPVICGVKGLIVTPVAGTYFCILQQRKNVALQGSNMLKPTNGIEGDMDYHLLGVLVDSNIGSMVCSLRDMGVCQEPSFGRRRWGCSLSTQQSVDLRKIQDSLGALAPAEWLSRDLQYVDSQNNDRQLQRAIKLLK